MDLSEIINGDEVIGLSPFVRHQSVIGNLNYIIHHYVKTNNLGKVYFSPLDVIFEEGFNKLQPDMLFIKKENTGILQDWVRGIPDMVCEVISPGSYEKDTVVKKEIYEKYRVPEYWLVMPEMLTVMILTIDGDRYKLHSLATIDGTIVSKVIEGLQVNIKDIFES